MKKLLYIGGFDLPDNNAACHRAISNSKLFKMIGIDSSVLGVSKDASLEKGVVHQLCPMDHIDMMVVSYPKGVVEWLKFIVGDSATLVYIRESKPDIVIMYNYPAIASIRINGLCRKSGIESICDITEWYSSVNKNLIRRVVKWLDTSLRIRVVARLNKRVITTSQYMTNFYESKGHKCLELPTLYDVEDLSLNIDNSEISPESEKTNLIYFGSPFDKAVAIYDNSQVKERLDKVVSAVSDNYQKHNLSLDVYGITKSDFLDVYPSYLSILEPLGERVTFYGRVPYRKLSSYISKADYSIFFRDDTRVNKAGFPSKLAESITLGIPVITSDISALKKYKNIEGVNLCSIGFESQDLDKILSRKHQKPLIDRSSFDYKGYKAHAKSFFDFNEV